MKDALGKDENQIKTRGGGNAVSYNSVLSQAADWVVRRCRSLRVPLYFIVGWDTFDSVFVV